MVQSWANDLTCQSLICEMGSLWISAREALGGKPSTGEVV